jgi:hypothetical protein
MTENEKAAFRECVRELHECIRYEPGGMTFGSWTARHRRASQRFAAMVAIHDLSPHAILSFAPDEEARRCMEGALFPVAILPTKELSASDRARIISDAKRAQSMLDERERLQGLIENKTLEIKKRMDALFREAMAINDRLEKLSGGNMRGLCEVVPEIRRFFGRIDGRGVYHGREGIF